MSSSFGNFNLYEELEIPRESTQEEIKKSYKKLAMKWHPDKRADDPTATEKFQRISHAYSILQDPKKRSCYDKYGTVDEDNWNFEEFMKNFKFDFNFDMFDDNLFGKKVFFEGGAMDSRHNLKLMYTRKKAFNKPYRKKSLNNEEQKESKEEFQVKNLLFNFLFNLLYFF